VTPQITRRSPPKPRSRVCTELGCGGETKRWRDSKNRAWILPGLCPYHHALHTGEERHRFYRLRYARQDPILRTMRRQLTRALLTGRAEAIPGAPKPSIQIVSKTLAVPPPGLDRAMRIRMRRQLTLALKMRRARLIGAMRNAMQAH
jgi:hypothetical protein